MKLHKVTLKILLLALFSIAILQARTANGYALDSQGSPADQAATGPVVCFTEPPVTSAYPDIKVNFRMFDNGLVPVTDLTDQQIRISENGAPAIPLKSGLQVNNAGGGIDFYFVLDRSNRADPLAVKGILREFLKVYQPDVDSVTLYTDSNNSMSEYYPSSSYNSATQAITNYPEASEDNMRRIDAALDGLAAQLVTTDACAKPKMIYFILGDGTFTQARSAQFAEIAKNARAKLALLHVPSDRYDSFQDKKLYEEAIVGANGVYTQILSPSDDAGVVFDRLSPYRQVYSASYQSNNGESGTHTIQVQRQGSNVPTAGENQYNISLLPPKINLSSESVVVRNALEQIEGGFSYDTNSQDVTVDVSWPDGFPRKLATGATLIISGLSSEEQRIPISLSSTGDNSYKFSWNFAQFQDRGQQDVVLSLEAADEFGLSSTAESGIQVSLLNKVSPQIYFKAVNWLVYGLGGLVLVLFIAVLLMWKRIGNLAVRGGQAVGKMAGEIRKTIVGGGRRKGKALASLRILDGPASLMEEEIKIFTEKVSLGRDPKVCDLTFYTPDSQSSVSGLHAILERVSGAWRLVAVSQSGSETFLDSEPIPFNEPVQITSGQHVRLGYLAQQPVVFEFQALTPSEARESDPKKTDVGEKEKTTPVGLIKVNKEQEKQLKKDASVEKESIFDEYLE